MMFKKVTVIATVALTMLTLTGCGNSETPHLAGSGLGTQRKQKTVDMSLARGKISQSSGLMTIPVVLKNIGTNSTVISSKNFTLEIQGHKFKPFAVPDEASDYHQDFDSNRTWNNTLSFYLGTTLAKGQLKYVNLYYQMDNGKKIKAKILTTSTDQSDIRSTLNHDMKSLGNYYQGIIDFTTKAKVAEKEGNSLDLKDCFSDQDYDKFKIWVVIPKSDPSNVIIKILNQTNTDVSIAFNDLELVDKNNDETRVSPSYRNYFLIVPHGKYSMISLPLESKLQISQKPFTTKVRTRDSFFSTKEAIYPIETVISTNGKNINTLFSLTPKEYLNGNIFWSKPVLDIPNNKLFVTVEINDYFALHANAKAFSLVGLNADKTVGEKEICYKVSPKKITNSDPTSMTLKFKDLSMLKNYPHIELKYQNTKIMQVK